jgi:hypothetical protein
MFHEQTRMLPNALDYIIVVIGGELEYAQCKKFQFSVSPEETSMLVTTLTTVLNAIIFNKHILLNSTDGIWEEKTFSEEKKKNDTAQVIIT